MKIIRKAIDYTLIMTIHSNLEENQQTERFPLRFIELSISQRFESLFQALQET